MNMFSKVSFRHGLAAFGLFALASSAVVAHNHGGGYGDDEKSDIVDTAVEAGQFSTLAAALEAADLVETLKGDGPFTVFAPTDEAFAALPEGTLDSLLQPENREQLVSILTYHVVSGKVDSESVSSMDAAETLNGQSVSISTDYGSVQIGNATVVQADIEASNGIIHVIDAVLLP